MNGTLAAGLGLGWLNGVAASLSPIRGGAALIVDRAGQLVAAPEFAGVMRVGDEALVQRAEAEAAGPGRQERVGRGTSRASTAARTS